MNNKSIVVGSKEWEEFKEELGITPEEMEAATEWFKSWIAEQKPVGAEYEQALLDNLDDLYEE